MSKLDAARVHSALTPAAISGLEKLEAFSSIASTNTYLLTQAPPAISRFRVAVADHQTSGRGRHDRRWLSAPGAGLYLSFAYTFSAHIEQLSSLTLAIGIGAIDALRRLGIVGVSLKWPNDIVALDGKLGGILTEVRAGRENVATVVTGVGINIDLPEYIDFGMESDWAHRAVDLKSIVDLQPERELLAAALVDSLSSTCRRFEEEGLAAFQEDWQRYDWLRGRDITVDMPDKQVTGRAAGIDSDGALLLETSAGEVRVISGSIVMAGARGTQ